MLEFGGQAVGALSQAAVAAGLTLAVDGAEALQPAASMRRRRVSQSTLPRRGGGGRRRGAKWSPRHAGAATREVRRSPITVTAAQRDRPREQQSRSPDGHRTPDRRCASAGRDVPARPDAARPRLRHRSGRSPDDPVELMVSGKVVARGEVVVVAGNYGVRVTEVVSTADDPVAGGLEMENDDWCSRAGWSWRCLAQAVLLWRVSRAMAGWRRIEERVGQFGGALTLLTETTESGFRAMATELAAPAVAARTSRPRAHARARARGQRGADHRDRRGRGRLRRRSPSAPAPGR